MALIQQTGSVYVNFTQSSGDLLRLRKAMAGSQLRGAGKDGTTVRIVLEDGSELPRAGRLLFSDLNVDASSGQITLRAEVPNPDGMLLPGQYVRVRLSQAELPSGMLLPQQAVTRTNQGDTVLVVGADGVPAKRQIRLGGNQNNQWIVLDGLQARRAGHRRRFPEDDGARRAGQAHALERCRQHRRRRGGRCTHLPAPHRHRAGAGAAPSAAASK